LTEFQENNAGLFERGWFAGVKFQSNARPGYEHSSITGIHQRQLAGIHQRQLAGIHQRQLEGGSRLYLFILVFAGVSLTRSM
jgi:hypothetical protein